MSASLTSPQQTHALPPCNQNAQTPNNMSEPRQQKEGRGEQRHAKAHLVCQLKGEMGVQLRKGGGHVHLGQSLSNTVARAVTEGEPPLALPAHVHAQVVHLLWVCCLCLAGGVQGGLLAVLGPRLQHKHDTIYTCMPTWEQMQCKKCKMKC